MRKALKYLFEYRISYADLIPIAGYVHWLNTDDHSLVLLGGCFFLSVLVYVAKTHLDKLES